MQVLSATPGRVRWHIASLRDRPALARDLCEELLQRLVVYSAKANALTGNLLVTFHAGTPVEQVERWVLVALDRALARPARIERAQALVTQNGNEPVRRLMQRVGEHQPLVTKMMTASFVTRVLDSSPPLLIGAGIDIVTRQPASFFLKLGLTTIRSQLFALGGVGLAIWAVNASVDYAHRRMASELANRVRNDLRNELYQHLQHLDLAQIESLDVSDWMNLLEGHLTRIHAFVKDGSDPIVMMAASGLAVGVSLVALSPQFALLQLLLVPPVAFASRELLGPLKERLTIAQREADRLSALLHGNVSSLATINSFASQELEAARVAEAGERGIEATRDADAISAAYIPVLKAIVGTGFTATLVHGGFQVADHALAPGAYNAVASSQLRLLAAIGHVGASIENYQRTRVSLRKVFDVLDMQPAITSPEHAVPFSTVAREITLDDVTFGYEPDRQVLRQMRMRFPAGQVIGIVGASGAGKSTILKLLQRFYDVQGGAVRYDGVDVRELKLEDLRHAIASVPQEVAVFAATVRDNIAYAHPEATDEQVERAARVAGAHDFISALPEGYDTRIGFAGLSLSAGQRQRLAIARAVIADRPILLFDEATSALDYQTEAAIQRSLRDVTEGRTTIIVAHRLSTIRRADIIYVLDEGHVKEHGVHDDLIARDGIYAAIWRVQTGESEEGEE